MHPANQRPGKPDKLSQGAHKQTSYPKIQREYSLDKWGATEPQRAIQRVAIAMTEGNVRSRARTRAYDYSCCRKLETR